VEGIGQCGVLKVGDFDEAAGVRADEQGVVGVEGQRGDAIQGVTLCAVHLCDKYIGGQ